MQFRLRTLLIVLAVTCGINSGSAAEPKPKTDFEFDPATVPTTRRADDSKIVARYYNRYIDLAELQASSIPLDGESIGRLQGAILGDLLKRLAEKEKLSATSEEVETFYRIVLRKRLDAGELHGDLHKNPNTGVGAMFVKNWKIDRLLFQRYGGTVIFQQGNPFEPVGAYRQLLEEAEKGRVFEIYGPADRKAFWSYFTRDPQLWVVPPDKVNYDQPWWLQKVEQ
jgi:hypothetical protein